MRSERRVLLSGGGVGGGADSISVSFGADDLILKRERKQSGVVLILSRNNLTHHTLCFLLMFTVLTQTRDRSILSNVLLLLFLTLTSGSAPSEQAELKPAAWQTRSLRHSITNNL